MLLWEYEIFLFPHFGFKTKYSHTVLTTEYNDS